METETETESDEEMEMMVFEVSEIESEYEFDAARWYDFTREELDIESRLAEIWFQTAQSYPPSPFALKLLMKEEVSDDNKTEPSVKSEDVEVTAGDVPESNREILHQPDAIAKDVNETGNGVFTFIHGGTLKEVPNQSLHKGQTNSNHIDTDKVKCRPKSSTRPLIPRSSTLMKPTASQLARQESIRLHMKVDQFKENGLCHSSLSEVQAAKRQKLDGGLLRKVAEMKQEMNFVHRAQHARTKITVPQELDFATSHRANRIRHKDDAKLNQDSTSVRRFKARPLNRKIFEAPLLPIWKKSTPKLPEFQEFHLKTSERAMQHSSALSMSDTTAFLDGVNREPRRPRVGTDIPKEDDRKQIFKARPLSNKIVSSRRDIGIFRKSKRETTVPLEKRFQPDLPTELFSKLSLTSKLQQNNGFPQPEQIKGSKENRLNSFQAGNERTSKVTGKPMVQRR